MSLLNSEIHYLLNAPLDMMTEDQLEDVFKRTIALVKAFPALKPTLKCNLEALLVYWGKRLERHGHYDTLFSSYKKALSAFYDHEGLLSNLGAFLLRAGYSEEACECFQEAMKVNPSHLPALRNLESYKNVCVERWHYRMLNDYVRNSLFRAAIIKKVKEGYSSVLDIGTGTGILSLFALEGGAREIYACDVSKVMVGISEKVFAEHKVADKIKLIPKLSNDISIPTDIPKRVQLVITETVDDGLLGENIFQTLIHAWDNLLLPCPGNAKRSNGRSRMKLKTGCVIPHSAHVWVAAIECSYIDLKYRMIGNKSKLHNACHNVLALNFFAFDGNEYDSLDLQHVPGGYKFLTQPTIGLKINFNNRNKMEKLLNGLKKEVKITCSSSGRIDGFAMWYDLNIDEDIKLTSGPVNRPNRAKCWNQAIFALQLPVFVKESDKLRLKFSCEGGMSVKLCSINKSDYIYPYLAPASNASNNDLSCYGNTPSCSRMVPDSIHGLPNNIWKTCPVSHDIISFLNDKCWLDSLNDALELYVQSDNGKNCIKLLDLSPFPVFGLAFLVDQLKKYGKCYSTLTCVACEEQDKNAIILVAKANNIGEEFLEILNGNLDDALYPIPVFDLILLHPIEMTGKMHEKYLTYLPLLSRVMKPSGVLMPKEITICCHMIYSEWLSDVSELRGNDRVCGYEIAAFINEYKVTEHLHFGVSAPEYNAYTEETETPPISMEQFMASVAEPLKLKAFCVIKNNGLVNALPYWYKIGMSYNSAAIPTNSWKSYVNQVAILISPPLRVSAGDSICITFTCHQGLMNASIEKKEI